jgi:hypothetical protein
MFAMLRPWRRPLLFGAALLLYLGCALAVWARLGPQPRYTLPAGCEPFFSSADGRLLVTGRMGWDPRLAGLRNSGPVQVWDLERGNEVASVLDDGVPAIPVALSPDQRWLTVRQGYHDQPAKLHLFALPSGKPHAVYPVPAGEPWNFACFSPDSRTLAVATGKAPRGTITLLDTAGEQPPRVLESLTSPFAYAPTGQFLAAAVVDGSAPTLDNTGEVRLLDPASGAVRGSVRARLNSVSPWLGLQFSPDGKSLAVSYHQATPRANGVALWDVAEQREKAWIEDGWGPYFLAEGKTLVLQQTFKTGRPPLGVLLVDVADPAQRTAVPSTTHLQIAHHRLPCPPQFVTFDIYRPPLFPLLPARTLLEVREPRTGEVVAKLSVRDQCAVADSRDGTSLVVCTNPQPGSSYSVAVWDLPPTTHPGRQLAGVAGLTVLFGLGCWLVRRRARAPAPPPAVAQPTPP